MQYVSRVPQPPLDQLVDDLYFLEGTPPYSRLKLPPMPSAVLILRPSPDARRRRTVALRRRFLADHPGNALDVGPLPAD
ncbi:hypothetical protein ACVCAH_16680 [Micromonospora sp. LZ34]